MNVIVRRASLSGLVLLGCVTTLWALDPAEFRAVRQIETQVSAVDTLVSVNCDSEVYRFAQSGLVDLRIFDEQGQVVPYLSRRKMETRETSQKQFWSVKPVSLQVEDESGLELRLELKPDDPTPAGLRIVTPLIDFEQRVQVYGAAPGQAEMALVTDAVIFDYSRYMDVRRLEIPLPESSARLFRIVVNSLTADQTSPLIELTKQPGGSQLEGVTERTTVERRPFRIDRVEFWSVSTTVHIAEETQVSYPVQNFEFTLDEDQRYSTATFSTDREPLTSIAIETPDRNFSRTVFVQVAEPGVDQSLEWVDWGWDKIHRIHLAGLDEEKLEIPIPERRNARWRVRIDNDDNPPLELSGVTAAGPVDELIFLAQPGALYQLCAGPAEPATAPVYDTAALVAGLNQGIEPVPVQLGSLQLQEPQPIPPSAAGGLINAPWFLGTVLVALVLLLTWVLYRAARRMQAADAGASHSPQNDSQS